MEIITGRTGTKHVRAADDARIYRMLFGSGDYVLQDGSQLIASKTGATEITISDGFLMSQGRLAGIYADKGAEVVTIDAGVSGVKREDTIVAEYSITTQGIESFVLKVIKGTQGSTYVSPSIITGTIDNGEVHQVKLWGVRMNGYTMEDELIDYRNVISINPIDQLYEDMKTYMSRMDAKATELQTAVDNKISTMQTTVDSKVTTLTDTVNSKVTTLQNNYNTFTSTANTTFTNTINSKFNSLRPAYAQAGDKVWFAWTGGGILTDGNKAWFSFGTRPAISGSSNPVLKNFKCSIRLSSGGHAVAWEYTDSAHKKWNSYTMSWNGSSNISDGNGKITHFAVRSVTATRHNNGIQVCVTFKKGLCKPDGKTYADTYQPIGIDCQGYYQL